MDQTYSNTFSRQSRASASRRSISAKLPLPIWIFIVAMLMPHTIAFFAGSALITYFRLTMIVLAVPILVRLASPQVRLALPDYLLFAFSAWSMLCILLNYGGGGVERAGQFLLEVTLPYLLARGFVTNIGQIYRITGLFFLITVLAFVLAVPEAITHKKPIIDYTSAITGIDPGYYAEGADVRMGLRRAQAFFENTILYGVFCAACVPWIWYTEKNLTRRALKLLVAVLATFLAISSAPILMITIQFLLIGVESATRNMRNRVAILGGAAALFFLVINVVSKSGPIGFVINYLTFNQESAYARVLIWDYGMQNIMSHPIFGMVIDNWVRADFMTPSIDNFWIYTGIISGFVGLGLLIALLVASFYRFNKVPLKRLGPDYLSVRYAWSILMMAMLFSGSTVMFFGKLQPFLYFMLGLGAAAAANFTAEIKRNARARAMAESRVGQGQ